MHQFTSVAFLWYDSFYYIDVHVGWSFPAVTPAHTKVA